MKTINADSLIAWATYESDHSALRSLRDILSQTTSQLGNEFVGGVEKAIATLEEKANFSLHNVQKWAGSLSEFDLSDLKKLSPQCVEQLKLAVSVVKLIDSRLRPIVKETAVQEMPDASVQISNETAGEAELPQASETTVAETTATETTASSEPQQNAE